VNVNVNGSWGFGTLEDQGIEEVGIGLCLAGDGRWKIGDRGASNPGNMDLREKQLMRHENYSLWYLM
jgi:hypothetical protein